MPRLICCLWAAEDFLASHHGELRPKAANSPGVAAAFNDCLPELADRSPIFAAAQPLLHTYANFTKDGEKDVPYIPGAAGGNYQPFKKNI